MFDDANLIERDRDGDAVILGLFRDWQVIYLDLGCGDDNEVTDRLYEIERQIYATPASGGAGMAVKFYIEALCERGSEPRSGAPLLLSGFSDDDYRDRATGELLANHRALRSLLIDASHFAPELSPLVANIVAAPAARPPAAEPVDRRPELRARAEALVAEYSGELPPGDAGLLEAERRQRALSAGQTALSREFEVDAETEEEILSPTVLAAETKFYDLIGDTEPETLAGIAVKLRWVRSQGDPEMNPGFALGQCLDALAALDAGVSQ